MKHTVETTIACLQDAGVADPVEEFLFHPVRKWRFDRAWVEHLLAWEIEGLTVGGGRHQRIKGYTEDLNKYNEALLLGWRILRTTPKQVESGQALMWLEKLLGVERKLEVPT